MSARTFFATDAKAKVALAIAEVEAQTSAEVVVALRPSSGHYRHTDYLVGFALAAGALLVFLFHPQPFETNTFPLEFAASFVIGTLASAHLPPLRRLLTSPRLMAEGVRTAARAAFVELGVGRTAGRTGVLVFVSMFERRVEVVADSGVSEEALGEAWRDARARLAAAVARDPDLDRFLAALRAVGPILGGALPHAADDVNELSDEVRA